MSKSKLLNALTAVDNECLARMPEGVWFKANELPYPAITRADYRCERLEKRGMLESRVVGTYPDLKREYRKVERVSLGEFQVEMALLGPAQHLKVKL